MRHAAFLCVFLLLFASCYKIEKVDKTLNYTITGIEDIYLPANDTFDLNIVTRLLSGDPSAEYITLTVKGLPGGVSLKKDSFTFRPNYYLTLGFVARNAAVGTYPLTVTVRTTSKGTQVHHINLNVVPPIDCVSRLLYEKVSDTMSVSSSCNTPSASAVVITRIESNKIGLSTLGSIYNHPVYAIINCGTSTITIPPQPGNGTDSIQGTGSYTTQAYYKTAIINLNVLIKAQPWGQRQCTMSLKK